MAGFQKGADGISLPPRGRLVQNLVRTAWILCEDPESRAEVGMAVESAGYCDVVAFEDAKQLLAHRPSRPPALAVIDSPTARFDLPEIHAALSGVPIVALVASDGHEETWRSLGVTLVLRWPPTTRAPDVPGLEGRTERAACDQESRPFDRSAQSLEALASSLRRSVA